MENKKKKKIRKRYKLKPRFFCIIISFLIIIGGIYKISGSVQANELPNFYGWDAEAIMTFEEEHPNLSIIYEFVYSETVRPTRVINQSIQPGIELGDSPLIITVQISKGLPVSE